MESKTVLDSGLYVVDSGFWIPGTWILDSWSVKFGFPVPIVTEWDSFLKDPLQMSHNVNKQKRDKNPV